MECMGMPVEMQYFYDGIFSWKHRAPKEKEDEDKEDDDWVFDVKHATGDPEIFVPPKNFYDNDLSIDEDDEVDADDEDLYEALKLSLEEESVWIDHRKGILFLLLE